MDGVFPRSVGKAAAMTPLSTGALQQMIEQTAETSEEAHKRLRESIRDLEGKLESVEHTQQTHAQKLATLEAKPVVLADTTITLKMVIGVVAVCAAIITGQWATAWGLRSDVTDTRTEVKVAAAQMQAHVEADKLTAKLQEERVATFSKALDDLSKQMQLQRVQLESLTKRVIEQQRR